MLKSNQPVSVKGVAALGAIVTLAALTGCVTRTREVVVERPTAPAVVVQQPVAANACKLLRANNQYCLVITPAVLGNAGAILWRPR